MTTIKKTRSSVAYIVVVLILILTAYSSCSLDRKKVNEAFFYPCHTYEKIMVKYYTDTIIIDMQPNGDKWIFTKGDNGYYLNVDNRKELFMSNEEYGQKTYPSTISEGNQHTIRFSHRDSYITTEYLLNISDSDKIPVMAITYDKNFTIYDVMIGANYVSYR